MNFAIINDLHLSDLPSTAAGAALEWALDQIEMRQPDFVAVAGDFTTYGTATSATLFSSAVERLQMPVFYTAGNAEHRDGAAMAVFKEHLAFQRRWALLDDLLLLLPDTSTGSVPPNERSTIEALVAETSFSRAIAITHYPLDRQTKESRDWMSALLGEHPFELLVAGHTHTHSTSQLDHCTQTTVRGLDPDKAIGDLPGLSFFVDQGAGSWQEEFVPWTYPVQLRPFSMPHLTDPIGWSVRGNPLEAVEHTIESGLSNLELRPIELNFSGRGLRNALDRLRRQGPLFLAYHLPSIKWQSGKITGVDTIKAHLDIALEIGAKSLTVHVPEAPVQAMADRDIYQQFVQLYTRIFAPAVKRGLRLAVENVHNQPQTPVEDPNRKFATTIPEYTSWLKTLEAAMELEGQNKVGAHLDIGHARNNGGPLDNMQPLGDWYAHLGQSILSYHIHQVGRHPQTGKLANHIELQSLFASRISYAGFFWAWSTNQLARAPLFVEIRDLAACRRSALRLKGLFAAGSSLQQSTQLADYFFVPA